MIGEWRNHKSHREETQAVKQALTEAGIKFKSVGHGKGTAWAWLEINLGPIPEKQYTALVNQTILATQAITGRHGDHHGDIMVLTQD